MGSVTGALTGDDVFWSDNELIGGIASGRLGAGTTSVDEVLLEGEAMQRESGGAKNGVDAVTMFSSWSS